MSDFVIRRELSKICNKKLLGMGAKRYFANKNYGGYGVRFDGESLN